jgi:nitric oxide reductase NorQ protein
MMVISYNPGYQSILKDLKPSTRQRFVALEFDYPARDQEAEIVAHEGRLDPESALKLVRLAEKIRHIREQGLTEGASTRLLIHAARLLSQGVPERQALRTAICLPLTDDERLLETLDDLIEDVF